MSPNYLPRSLTDSVSYTAPNGKELAVEIVDAVPYQGGTVVRAERLNFQIQVYETTNVIEFHYCSLVANTGSATDATGASATIGLENAAGTEGVQHSFNQAAAVDTVNALRFTP